MAVLPESCDRLWPDAAVQACRAEIEGLASRKCALGEFEPDDSVIIRTADVD